MQQTIPVKDLKDTARVTQLCEEADEPVTVTRNGIAAMYLVNTRIMERMQKAMAMQSLYARLEHSEAQIAYGDFTDYVNGMDDLRARYGL